jgi:hypothetical protein
MGVAVDQAAHAVVAQRLGAPLIVHVHDFRGLFLHHLPALLPHLMDLLPALAERLGREGRLNAGSRALRRQVLVVEVVGAQRVAVHQQRFHTRDVHDRRVLQQLAPVAAQKPSPIRKSRLPCIRSRRTPRRVRSFSRPAITALNGSARSSSPIQYSKKSPRMYSAPARRLLFQKRKKRSFAAGPLLGEVQIRDEKGVNALCLLLRADHRHRLDDHRLARHVAREGAAPAGRRLGDLGHHVHAGHDFAEHRIAVAVTRGSPQLRNALSER